MLWRIALIASLLVQPVFGFGLGIALGAPANACATEARQADDACCPMLAADDCCPLDEPEPVDCGCFAPVEPAPTPPQVLRVAERTDLAVPDLEPVSVCWASPRRWIGDRDCGHRMARPTPSLAQLCVWVT